MKWVSELNHLLTSWNGIPYLDAFQCLREEYAPAILICIGCGLVFSAYVMIVRKWAYYESRANGKEGAQAFKKLRWIFILCSICGYLWNILHFFWPAYNLLIFFLFILAFWSWRFALTEDKHLKEVYEKISHYDKMKQEVKELRKRINE